MNNEELIKKIRDPKYYLENFCRIKTKTEGLQPFILKEAQKDLFNTLKNWCRIMILKCRQLGFSTAATGWIYHYTITNPGVTCALIGYNSDLTAELLDKVKTFHRTTPDEIRPMMHYNSKYEISFPKMDSKILVLPSTETVGRGYTLNAVLCTELAFWEKAEEKMSALEASVPITGKIIIESSPNWVGNLFHRMWVGENNGYEKKDYGWWWGYSEEEIRLIEKRMNDPLRFAREYECEFMASGRPVFDPIIIKEARRNILKIGDPVEGTDYKVEEEDGWRIYKKPKEKGFYVCGVDVSEGVRGGDYSVATIVDRTNGEEVAFFRGLLHPAIFADKLDKMGRRYHNALMVVESNNHGLSTITCLREKIYPTMYFRPSKFETLGMGSSDKMGWHTNKLTRPLLIDELGQTMRSKLVTFHSKEILDEMLVFVYDDNGEMVAQSGFHDDCIFSSGMVVQGFKVLFDKPLDQINYSNYLPKNFNY